MSELKDIAEALIGGSVPKVKDLINKALEKGIGAGAIIKDGLIVGMSIVGEKFKRNEIYVPEVMLAARAMHAGLDILKPLLVEGELEPVGTIVIGTVKGDLHDIGKNLVAMMLEGAGFKVINLGVNISPEKFVQAVKEHNPDILGLSALLTTTMVAMKDTIEALKAAGLRDKVKVIIGGAPVTQQYADEIGADGYSSDASSAVELGKSLLGIS
jgi:5-methyltetrahydrofolate--homocysteine methyltransferase